MKEYFRNIYLGVWTVLLGMRITIIQMFRPGITLQYPDERWDVPDGYRGRLHNIIEDCIGCRACERDCPVDCITIETEKPGAGQDLGKTSNGVPIKLKTMKFDIDMSLCMYCGLCTEACPTDCLIMTKEYEYATTNREDLIYHFANPEIYAYAPKKPQAQAN